MTKQERIVMGFFDSIGSAISVVSLVDSDDSINDSITQMREEIQKGSKKNPKDSKAMQSIEKKYALLPKEELFDFSKPIRFQKDKKESND